MKTTSTIKIKYPGHNTQKAAFPLCVMPTDTPNREDANRRKTDITTLQVDAIVNTKLTKCHHLPTHYVIHTAAPIWHGGARGEGGLLASCYRYSLPFPSLGTDVYTYLPRSPSREDHGNRARNAENCLGIEKGGVLLFLR